MTGDRNASLLAKADDIAERFGSNGFVKRDLRDAIYDALASSSASGAERMREAAAKVADERGGYTAGAIAEAILALPDPAPVPAWRPKVKALRWAEHTENSAVVGWNAPSALGAYYIDLRYGDAHLSGPGSFSASFASQEAARAAAQADYEQRILSALDVPEPASAPAWRDIATAPKDGRYLIVGRFNGVELRWVSHSRWMTADEAAENEAGHSDDYDAGWTAGADEYDYCHPTHWQPLHPPPQITEVVDA